VSEAGARQALAGVAALLALLGPGLGRAEAEEGLFTARASGGVSTVHPDEPRLGGIAQLGWTLGWTDAVAVTMTATYVGHRAFDTASLGLGLRLEGNLGEWTHPYLLIEPSVLFAFDSPETDPISVDAAGRAALGLDYLILWGLGLVVEVSGTLPAGLGAVAFPRAASACASLGLYMEF
jgi:hypothetical protein